MALTPQQMQQLLPKTPRQLPGGGYDPDELDRWMQKVTALLGSPAATQNEFNITGLTNKVDVGTTINGHELEGAVVLSASDLQTGTLPHAQLPALQSADIPNNAANTTGTAAGLAAGTGQTVVITTAKLTTGGAQGSMTFTNGILTAQVPAS